VTSSTSPASPEKQYSVLKLLRTIACLIGLLHAITVLHSQDFIFKHYDVPDGLASPTIHSIFQDRDGFLWIGTESGLCRYDGTHFKTFTVKDGLQGNEVFGMIQDKKGRIWLQQYKNKIAYIYNGRVYNQENDTLLGKIKLRSRIMGMTLDKKGNVVLCDEMTLYMISDDDHAIIAINSSGDNPVRMNSLGTNHAGEILICGSRDLYKVENYKLKYVRQISPSSEIAPTLVIINPNYVAYALSDSLKFIYLHDTTIQYKKLTRHALKLSGVSDSVFSINTVDGAILYNIKSHHSMQLLGHVKVTNVFLDSEKNLWLGTVGKGLYKLSSQDIVNNKIPGGNNDIFYITKSDGKIIVGNNNSQVYEYHNRRFINKIKVPIDSKILYYSRLDKDRLLVSTEHILIRYNKGIPGKTLYLVVLKNISNLDYNNCLLSAHSGVYMVRKNDITITDTIWRRRTLFAEKAGDSILAGTTTGIYILKKTRNKWVIIDSLLHSLIITSAAKTEDGCLWVSTHEDGLYCIKNGKAIRHFTDTNGLPSNNIRTMHINGDKIWLGTDRGLVKINSSTAGFRLQKYSVSDGLPSDIINSIYVDGESVYIGTPEGLCIFNESKIGTTSICNLVLTSVMIGDKAVELDNSYIIGRRQRFVIEFSGISFRSEKEMTYRYNINGLNDNWRYTNSNTLELTALPYGNYDIEIVAINKFGKESVPLKIHLNVPRPFHKTAWFTALIILLSFVLILFLYSWWLNRKKSEQLKKLKQEIRLLELEQMALRAQMNPHFIFNCISTLQQLVMEQDMENMNRFITSFSNLVRQTLDNAAEPFIPLTEEIKFLTSYLELEKIRLEDRFSYNITSSGLTHEDQPCVPNMVIQPFIENAIKHGIRYKKDGKGHIEVTFVKEPEVLHCTITDNGIGREKATQLKKQAGTVHASKGMSITARRMESLNSLTKGKISVTVDDIKDATDKVKGTRVAIEFYKLCE
jgi:ligand-binding sensor domain-containing protein